MDTLERKSRVDELMGVKPEARQEEGNRGLKIIHRCELGERVKIWNFVNLYGCKIGDDCTIHSFVEIQKDVVLGNKVTVLSNSVIPSKTKIGNGCLIGQGVIFMNDKNPPGKWEGAEIGDDVIIGPGSIIFPVKIGDGARIGAGSMVDVDVPAGSIVNAV